MRPRPHPDIMLRVGRLQEDIASSLRRRDTVRGTFPTMEGRKLLTRTMEKQGMARMERELGRLTLLEHGVRMGLLRAPPGAGRFPIRRVVLRAHKDPHHPR